MAIINCPECKSEISNQAPNCPKCGFPISMGFNKPQQIVIKKNEGCFLQTMNIGCLIILVFIAMFVISVIYFSSNIEKFSPKKETKDSINNHSKGGRK